MTQKKKKILLVDLNDERRVTRIALLEAAGYEVTLRTDQIAAEAFDHEGDYDLVVLTLHKHPELAAQYGDRLTSYLPRLPILLLTDHGVFVPPGTLNRSMEGGNPGDLMATIASMLAGSTHIRELTKDILRSALD